MRYDHRVEDNSEQSEERIPCNQCNNYINIDDYVVDESTFKVYCDEDCFIEWASINIEYLIEEYIRSNVYNM